MSGCDVVHCHIDKINNSLLSRSCAVILLFVLVYAYLAMVFNLQGYKKDENSIRILSTFGHPFNERRKDSGYGWDGHYSTGS